MIGAVSNIVVALVVLGVIIVFHEAGHFFVAKLFGIRVETFSIGFGPRLFGFRRGDTDYRVSALPLGGYVKMSGENPGDEVHGEAYEFMSKPKWQRFLVAFAGPAMNGVLAVGLLAGMYVYGVEERRPPSEMVIGNVVEGSPADDAGIRAGDVIAEFDGDNDVNWSSVELEVVLGAGRSIPMVLERNGERIDTVLVPDAAGPRETGYAGFEPDEVGTEVVGYSMEDSPAERAGLRVGDEIVGIDDVDLRGASTQRVIEVLQESSDDVVSLTVVREGETVQLEAEPVVNETGNRILGIQIDAPLVFVQLGPLQAIDASLRWNAANAVLIFDILGRLVRREVSTRAMDGPIGIINETGRRYQQGFQQLLLLVVIISLNLGIINLLPIPILDGGVMLLLAIEGVIRKDLSLAVKERIAQVSFVFLLTLIVFVLYNDIVNLSDQIGE